MKDCCFWGCDMKRAFYTQVRGVTWMGKKVEAEAGESLCQTLVSLTGLPEEMMEKELGKIIESAGKNKEDITLDELRAAMLEYLEIINEHMTNPSKNV